MLLLSALFFSGRVFGQTAPGTDGAAADQAESSLAAIVQANELQGKGKHPFHLKVSYQSFDLFGKPDEQGALEYWWAGDEGFHLDITSPSLGTLHSVSLNMLQSIPERRRLYLVNDLLDAMRAPGATAAFYKDGMASNLRSTGNLKLKCMQAGQAKNQIDVCTGETGSAIRMVTQPDYLLVRNTIGNYAGTEVSLDEAIYLAGKMAIKGHIEALDGFDPAQHRDLLDRAQPSPAQPGAPYVSLPGHVLAGQIVSKVNPTYPDSAKSRHVSGQVLLHAEITEQGHVESLFPIASADPALTQAAIDAVKQWAYRPYLLNGSPVRVSTTVYVNFSLN